MKKLLKFKHFRLIREAEENLETLLDSVYESTLNENLGAALGSPVKFTKLKNNAKAYQKALVQKAINNLDFEKKKAAGTLDPAKKEVLAAANKQKNQALQDEVTAISQRMDQLATTSGLKAVSSMAKNKSQMAAAQIAAKTADGEEAKALKLKIQGLNKKIKDNQEELEDYKDKTDDDQTLDNVKTDSGETIKDQKDKEAKAKADEENEKKVEAAQKKIEAAKKEYDEIVKTVDLKTKEGKERFFQAGLKLSTLDLAKAELEEDDEKIKRSKEAIEKAKEGIKKAETDTAEGNPEDDTKTEDPGAEQKAVDDATTKLKTATDTKATLKPEATDEEKAAADKAVTDAQTELDKAKEALAKAKETDNSSVKSNYTDNQYIGESVADKFRYLMNNRLK